jgi:hypothetical protein
MSIRLRRLEEQQWLQSSQDQMNKQENYKAEAQDVVE